MASVGRAGITLGKGVCRGEGVSYLRPLFGRTHSWSGRPGGRRETATHAYLLRNSIVRVEIFTAVQRPLTLARRVDPHPPVPHPRAPPHRGVTKIFFRPSQTVHPPLFCLSRTSELISSGNFLGLVERCFEGLRV